MDTHPASNLSSWRPTRFRTAKQRENKRCELRRRKARLRPRPARKDAKGYQITLATANGDAAISVGLPSTKEHSGHTPELLTTIEEPDACGWRKTLRGSNRNLMGVGLPRKRVNGQYTGINRLGQVISIGSYGIEPNGFGGCRVEQISRKDCFGLEGAEWTLRDPAGCRRFVLVAAAGGALARSREGRRGKVEERRNTDRHGFAKAGFSN